MERRSGRRGRVSAASSSPEESESSWGTELGLSLKRLQGVDSEREFHLRMAGAATCLSISSSGTPCFATQRQQSQDQRIGSNVSP
jgi:hypothetical protein